MKSKLFAVLILICVSGVASGAKKSPPPPQVLSATHGYVRASIPQWELAADLRLVTLRREPRGKYVKLESRHGARSWEAWVPAGTYVLAADVNGYENLKRAALDDAGKPFAPVIVRAGEMIDLGVLFRVPVGDYEYQLVPTEDTSVADESAQAFARVADVLKSREVIRWRPVNLPQLAQFAERQSTIGLVEGVFQSVERDKQVKEASASLRRLRVPDEFLAFAKALTPPTSDEPAVDADGSLYYGADLGQIRVRDAGGKWSYRDTGTGVEVTAVEFHAGHLVAGNLRGQLLISEDGGKSWQGVRSLDPAEVVVDIDRAGSHWVVLTALFEDQPAAYYLGSLEYPPGEPKAWALKPTVRVYLAARDDLSDIDLFREFQVKRYELVLGHRPGTPDGVGGFALGDDYLVHTYTGIYRLTPSGRQWAEVQIPTPLSTLVRASADGEYLSVVSPYKGMRHDYSTDGGKTWTRHVRPVGWTYDIVLTSDHQGRSTKTTLGRFTRTIEFYELNADGDDWQKVGEAPGECVRMLRDAAFDQRYCVSRHGSILSLVSGTWKIEFAAR